MDLSIIIVSWNVREYLLRCLSSLAKTSHRASMEIIVVDNASTDGSLDMVRKEFPQAVVIANDANRGFAAANNQGIRQAKGEYLLLLNPDTEVDRGMVDSLFAWMQNHPTAGIAGCKLLNSDQTLQPSVRRFPTLAVLCLYLLKLHRLFPGLPSIKRYLAQDFDYTKEQGVDQVMGACMMIRKKTIDEVGFLDEKFFVWFEEVDFCYRAREDGWGVWYTPASYLIHHLSQSFGKVSAVRKQARFALSARHYARKHLGFAACTILTVLAPLSMAIGVIQYLYDFRHRKV